jgi:hypothetical protein
MASTPAPTERVYERHLDLLLAQELECNDTFFQWFLNRCTEVPLYDATRATREIVIGHWDPMEQQSQYAGEDDLYVSVMLTDGQELVLLIENKIDAVLQPNQIGRYQARAQRHEETFNQAFVISIAPQSYLESHAKDLADVITISIEDIADALSQQSETTDDELARRLLWTANRMTRLRESRKSRATEYPPTIELRDHIIEELLKQEPMIEPRLNSMRTANTTWLYMSFPSSIIMKISHDVVDIYLRDIPGAPTISDLEASKTAIPEGFELTHDSSNNEIARFGSGKWKTIDELWSNGKPVNPEQLTRLVGATVRATRWVTTIS